MVLGPGSLPLIQERDILAEGAGAPADMRSHGPGPLGDSASQELPHESPLTGRPSLPLQQKYMPACWVLAVGAAIVLCSWASRETGALFHLLYKSLPWGILSAPSPALLSPWIGISGDIPGY